MRKALCLAPLAAALLLTGCINLAPDYVRPEAPVAAAWPAGEAEKNVELVASGLAQWGDFFTDPRLKDLIALGLKNNRDLRVAMYDVEQARAQYNVSRSQLFPTVAAVATETANRTSRQASATGRGVTTHTYSAQAAMSSFELDLFGRIRNLNEEALQSYFATEAAQRTAQMTVITEIAQTWLSLGAAQEQLKLAQSTLKSQEESLALIQKSFEIGAASDLDVEQAKTTVASAKASNAQALRAVSQYRNALTTLVGGPVPENLMPNGLQLEATKMVTVASNVPSEVLLQRPDVMQSEAQLKAANADIGVARAAFFPSISLTSSVGVQSLALSNLFDGGAGTWSFVPKISLPIFTGGANIATLRASEAAQKAAVASYEGTIQKAFQEVADALATEGTVTNELQATKELADATQKSYDLAMVRYKNGTDDYLTVLTSQRANFSAQQSLISAQLARSASLVTLYKVMGGGSQLSQSEEK